MAQFVKYFPAGFGSGMADTLISDQLAHGRVDNWSSFIDSAFGLAIGTKKAQVVKAMSTWLNDARDGQSGIKGYKIRANVATLFTVALATLDGLPADDAAIHADFLTLWAPAPKAKAATSKAGKAPTASEAASDKAPTASEAAIPAPGDIVAGTIALIQSGLIGKDSLAALEAAIAAYHAARVAPVAIPATTPATPSEALI